METIAFRDFLLSFILTHVLPLPLVSLSPLTHEQTDRQEKKQKHVSACYVRQTSIHTLNACTNAHIFLAVDQFKSANTVT